MLQASIGFFILSLIAMFVGAHEIAGVTVEIGQLLLVIFLVLALISFVADQIAGPDDEQSTKFF